MTRSVAVVTGAGRGVGRATVERLARGGYVVVAGVRDPNRAREEYGNLSGVHLVELDVTEPAHIRRAAEIATDLAPRGAIDVLVNNAGYAMMGAQENGDLDAARRMFETNLWGAAAMVQAFVPAMRAARRGTVVTVSSIGARLTNPLVGFYHASKYALNALSEALSVELGPFGVRVVIVEPGMVRTDFPKATVLTGDLTDPQSPYASLFGDLRAGFAAWRDRPDVSTGDTCAEAIWHAIHANPPPIRVVVGDDAAELDRAIRDSADDVEFQQRLRGFLQLDWAPAARDPSD
ncbi:MAG: SDR family oxidoreductase [Thermoleophilia bacterium]|nr:SDR family oxidoreductase [Thermoleophilia bacterium]